MTMERRKPHFIKHKPSLVRDNMRRIIKAVVKEELERLLEYAIPRAKFVDNVWHLSQQIVENWCLVHYSTLIGGHQTQDHWRKELRSHMLNIANDNIKGNNSYDSRLKAIREGFEMKDLFLGQDRIMALITNKFLDEGIDIESNEVKQTALDFSNSLEGLMSVMSMGDQMEIRNYSNEI